MPWVFKLRDSYLLRNAIENSENFVYRLEQRRNFSGKEDDNVLILSERDKSWKFLYSCNIKKIDVQELDDSKDIGITFGDFDILKGPNSLDDYSYSLKRIFNFKTPMKHFTRKYAFISDLEYEAIKESKIFISRTAFGKLVNALHIDHRLNFLRSLIDEKPQIYYNPMDYSFAYQALINYLRNNLFQHIRWLTITYSNLQNILEPEDLREIGFLDYEDDELDEKQKRWIENIHTQVNMINNYEVSDNQLELLEEILVEIRQASENEKSFSRLFKGQPLPIQLNF